MNKLSQTSRKRRRTAANPPTRLSWPPSSKVSASTLATTAEDTSRSLHHVSSSSLEKWGSDNVNINSSFSDQKLSSFTPKSSSSISPSKSESVNNTSSRRNYATLKSISFHPNVNLKKTRGNVSTSNMNRKMKSSSSSKTPNNNKKEDYVDDAKNNQLWVDKYKPTKIEEICIAPKKIGEVREWMVKFQNSNRISNTHPHDNYRNQSRSKLLILVGSAGIGKSTLVHLLANELHWNILEWNELHQTTTMYNTSYSRSMQRPVSQLSSFEEFLSNAALGWNIPLVQSKQSAPAHEKPSTRLSSKQSILLIDEIPNLHTKDNESRFRDILSQYLQKTQIPTIFIYSNVLEGKYNPDDLAKFIDPMILASPSMVRIMQINPATKAKMKQCILRIVKQEEEEEAAARTPPPNDQSGGIVSNFVRKKRGRGRQRMKAKPFLLSSSLSGIITNELIEELHSQSGGDIRHAIMTLQFQFVGLVKESIACNRSTSGGGSSSSNSQLSQGQSTSKSGSSNSQRDVRLSTFHALGKLLYAKRLSSKSKSKSSLTAMTTTVIANYQNFHDASWNNDKRQPLEFEPEQVLDQSAISLNNAVHFMGYHSPDFFSDIDDLEKAMCRFSDAALFMDKSYVSVKCEKETICINFGTNPFFVQLCVILKQQTSNINDVSFPNGYATSLISRSVGDANKHPAPSKYRPLSSPKVYDVIRKSSQNKTKAVQLCKKLSNQLEHLDLQCTVWASSSFSLEYLPLLKQIIPEGTSEKDRQNKIVFA